MDNDSIDIAVRSEDKSPEKKSAARVILDYARTILITLLVAFVLKVFVVEAYRIPSASMENTLQIGDFLIVNKLAYGLRTPRYLPGTNVRIASVAVPLLSSVNRGDVIVFEFPDGREYFESHSQTNYIKRCIGLPGDSVEIRGSQVFVNGRRLTTPSTARLVDPTWPNPDAGNRILPGGKGYTEDDFGPIVVPKKGDQVVLTPETWEDWKSLIFQEGHRVYIGADGIVHLDGKPAQDYTVEDDYYFVLGDNRHNSLDSRYWGFVPDRNLVGEALMIYWSWDPEIAVSDLADKIGSIRWSRIGKLIR